jgi:hypothetical protein
MHRRELIRFVTINRHPPYGHRSGIFAAAYALWREQRMAEPDRVELRTLLDWFEAHLAEPNRFAASRHPHAKETAICWVRTSAREHMTRLRRLTAIVETAGVAVDELRTTCPGYVVYQDLHQVVALPFADTPC